MEKLQSIKWRRKNNCDQTVIRINERNIRFDPYFGKELKKKKQTILRNIGSLVESPSYYGNLSARENLELLQIILQVPKERIDEVLAIVRLEKDSDRPVKGFSLGMNLVIQGFRMINYIFF